MWENTDKSLQEAFQDLNALMVTSVRHLLFCGYHSQYVNQENLVTRALFATQQGLELAPTHICERATY